METNILEKEAQTDVQTSQNFDAKTALQTEDVKLYQNDIDVIILLNKNFDIKGTLAPYDLDIMGKKMWEWVALACGENNIKTTFSTEESNILTLIKPYLTNSKWTLVLFSDTPLFNNAGFKEILNFAKIKQPSVVLLERGFLLDTEYAKGAREIFTTTKTKFSSANFTQICNNQTFFEVKQIIKNSILDFHIANGVFVEDKTTCFVDCEVIIEKGTRIMPCNTILGTTYIGKNCVLYPNNTISNSIIGENCIIKSSNIDTSRISENIVVGPFESVVNKSS